MDRRDFIRALLGAPLVRAVAPLAAVLPVEKPILGRTAKVVMLDEFANPRFHARNFASNAWMRQMIADINGTSAVTTFSTGKRDPWSDFNDPGWYDVLAESVKRQDATKG